jgi:ribosomal protein S27E
MIQRNRATQDARAGEVFAESIEKMGFATLDFARSAGIPFCWVENGPRKKNAARKKQRMAAWLILNESWKSKMEIPDNTRIPEDSFIEIECPSCHSKRAVFENDLQPIKCYSCNAELSFESAHTAVGPQCLCPTSSHREDATRASAAPASGPLWESCWQAAQ